MVNKLEKDKLTLTKEVEYYQNLVKSLTSGGNVSFTVEQNREELKDILNVSANKIPKLGDASLHVHKF